ncbi:hypothetical protein GCM10027436_62460 [Actinophytocola sediminis]
MSLRGQAWNWLIGMAGALGIWLAAGVRGLALVLAAMTLVVAATTIAYGWRSRTPAPVA